MTEGHTGDSEPPEGVLLAGELESQGLGGELMVHGKGEARMGLWLQGQRGARGAEWPGVGASWRREDGRGLRAGPVAAVAPGASFAHEILGVGNSVACGPQPPCEYH